MQSAEILPTVTVSITLRLRERDKKRVQHTVESMEEYLLLKGRGVRKSKLDRAARLLDSPLFPFFAHRKNENIHTSTQTRLEGSWHMPTFTCCFADSNQDGAMGTTYLGTEIGLGARASEISAEAKTAIEKEDYYVHGTWTKRDMDENYLMYPYMPAGSPPRSSLWQLDRAAVSGQ